MISFYDKLVECLDDYEELTNLLINLDYMLELLHNNGLCVYDFDPKRIILYNDKFTYQSFNGLLNDIGVSKNSREANIWQLSKIGIMAYNHNLVNGDINEGWRGYLANDIKPLNQLGNIPEEIFEYYEEVFINGHYEYLNNYLIKKQQELNGEQHTNVIKKTKSTEIGRALAHEDNQAFINILFIPSILVLIYLIGLVIYMLFIK